MINLEKPRFTATPLRLSDFPDAPQTFEHGHRWGIWLLDAKRLCLCAVRGGVSDPEQSFYEIDLEEITGAFWLVDWLVQIEQKSWANPEVLGQLTTALLNLFRPRSSMRDSGTAKVIDPLRVLSTRITLPEAA